MKNENSNNLEKLFKILKELAENGGEVNVINMNDQSGSLEDILFKNKPLKEKSKESEPSVSKEFEEFLQSIQGQIDGSISLDEGEEEEDEEDEEYTKISLEELLSSLGQLSSKKRDAKKAAEGMTDKDKINAFIYAMMEFSEEHDINRDILFVELLSFLAMSSFMSSQKNLGPLTSDIKKDARAIVDLCRGEGGVIRTSPLNKVMELGEGIYKTMNKNDDKFSDYDIVVALSYALATALRN